MFGMISRRPLTASTLDQALYVSTPSLDQATAALRLGTNLLIVGGPGSGKTSLLRRLESKTPGVLVVNGEQHPTVSGLLGAITSDLVDDELTSSLRSEVAVDLIAQALEANRERGQDPIEIIAVDGASPEQLEVLFGRYRDALWELPVQWILTSRRRPVPPADSFFDRTIMLEQWNAVGLGELLTRRLPDVDESQIEGLVQRIAPATPVATILACQTLLMLPEDERNDFFAVVDHEAETVNILPPGLRAVYAAVKTLGPVSASDPRLIDAVGVSRSRLTHSLKELEDSNVVSARREGRRVLYNTRSNEVGSGSV